LPFAKLGLISDTHGLLRPDAVAALQGSELIVHAGDVGKPEILDALRRVAPVVAVRGNIDSAPWAQDLLLTETVQAGSTRILVIHNVHELDSDSGFDIVISGHSHKPAQFERGGVLYVNPGSAGPRRFRLPITVARLDLARRPWRVDFIELSA
jgi:putative phosphoesterase